MLTKTRKWLLTFVIAFVAIFLAACKDEEKEPEEVKPTDLTIEVITFVGDKGTVVGGDQMELLVSSTTENADLSVDWSSDNEKVAIVDSFGKVTGRIGGVATITATSKFDASVKNSVKIKVYDKNTHVNDDLKALIDASEQLKVDMPEFVEGSFDLPKPTNALIKVVYKDEYDNIFVGGKFIYADYILDRYESIKVEMSYGAEKMVFPYVLKIVDNATENDFLANEEAQQYVARYLDHYKSGLKVYGNITFPKSLVELKTYYNEVHTGRDVAISWKSTNTTILTNTGAFIRPNDDTNVTLEVFFRSNNISSVIRHNLLTKGYTPDEMVTEILGTIPNQIQAKNISLPTYFGKFSAVIEWTSDKPLVLSTIGKTNPYVTEETLVTLTANIKYPGTTNDSFEFVKVGSVVVKVIPAANDAQAVALELSNRYETEINTHFPYGVKDREVGNVLSLPATVGGDGEFKDIAVTWTSAEEELFNAEWELQKQFLRYHGVTLTYSVTINEKTATGEITVNTGIAEKANTIYAGGNMFSRSTSQAQPYDELHQMSPTDGRNGVTGSDLNVFGWSGITFYTDITKDGVVTRYQFFASNLYSISLDDINELTVDDNFVVIGGATRGNGTKATNNRQYTIVNNTIYDLGVPVHTTNADYLAKTTLLAKDLGGQANAGSGMGMRLGFNGFVVDATGKVIMGYGTTTLVDGILGANPDAETLPNAIVIPAGGFAVSGEYATMPALIALFADVDQSVFLQQYNVK